MQPLAKRLRPTTLNAYVGQRHLVGPGAVLRASVEAGRLPSIILYGPPGVGKTTLAQILARTLERPFFELSAIAAGVKDVREAIEKAKKQRFFSAPPPVLFIDEIHRFSKSQQDALLGAVERGVVALIGATTENPSFEVIPALISRCQVYVLEALTREELVGLVDAALREDTILAKLDLEVREYDALLRISGGDARKLLNAVELVAQTEAARTDGITDDLVRSVVQNNLTRYDKGGEQHYDIASALIKCIRASDPDAAVYWLARMLHGGEDVKFIARRLVISAAEDIGLANPNALLLAQSTFDAVASVGMPEARIILAEATVYLAASAKSRASYDAIKAALAEVERSGDLPVPLNLRNVKPKAPTLQGHAPTLLPHDIAAARYYTPTEHGSEAAIAARLRGLWRGRYD